MLLKWFAALSLLVASMALFYPSWDHPYVLDDVAKVETNPDLRSPQLRFEDLFQNYSRVHNHSRNDPSRPLTFLLYWLGWQIGEGSPMPFHILNAILHGLCAFFVGLLAVRLSRRFFSIQEETYVFFIASLLFLTLPLNAGTVIYIYGLSDVLSAVLALAILLWISQESSLGPGSLVGLTILFVLALGAKQSSVVIPALAWVVQPAQRRAVILLFAIAGLYVVSRLLQFGQIGDLEAHEVYPVWDYFASQGALYFKYLRLALWPSALCLDHAIFPRHFAYWEVAIGWTLVTLATVFGLWKTYTGKGWSAWLGLGWLIFCVALLPTSSIFPTTDLFVERRAYLSTVGVVLVMAMGFVVLVRRQPKLGWIAALAAMTVNGYLSWARNEVFSKKENVWLEVLTLYPQDARARLNLSTAYLESRRWQEAKDLLDQLIKEEPKNFQAWANLGALFHSDLSPFHNPQQAWVCYQRVLEMEPNNLNTLSNAGYLMLMNRQPDQAVALFSRAIAVSPKSPQYHLGLGRALMMKGDQAEARREFEQALHWDPQFTPAQQSLRQLASESR